MKHILSITLIALLLVACGEEPQVPQNLKDLNTEKTALKKQIDSLSKKLQLVESAISDLDTTKRLVVVTTFQPKEEEFKHYIEVQGAVKADQSVELHPEIGGTITRIYAKEGQRVSKGQLLASIDDGGLSSQAAQMETQYALAKTTFERQKRLWDQKIGSEIQFLQAKANMEGLESSVKQMKAQVSKTTVSAPFTGTIDEVFAKVGQLANPQMPFLRIINLKKVYLETEITESFLKDIKKGTDVDITFPSLNKNLTSKISQVGNFINPNNRSFKARIDIINKEGDIKANLLANVKINDFKANGIIIPSYTIQKDSKGNSFVYTIKDENGKEKVAKTMVTVAKEFDNQSYISEGLTASDKIIDKGAKLVKNDDEVSVAN